MLWLLVVLRVAVFSGVVCRDVVGVDGVRWSRFYVVAVVVRVVAVMLSPLSLALPVVAVGALVAAVISAVV